MQPVSRPVSDQVEKHRAADPGGEIVLLRFVSLRATEFSCARQRKPGPVPKLSSFGDVHVVTVLRKLVLVQKGLSPPISE